MRLDHVFDGADLVEIAGSFVDSNCFGCGDLDVGDF